MKDLSDRSARRSSGPARKESIGGVTERRSGGMD